MATLFTKFLKNYTSSIIIIEKYDNLFTFWLLYMYNKT